MLEKERKGKIFKNAKTIKMKDEKREKNIEKSSSGIEDKKEEIRRTILPSSNFFFDIFIW